MTHTAPSAVATDPRVEIAARAIEAFLALGAPHSSEDIARVAIASMPSDAGEIAALRQDLCALYSILDEHCDAVGEGVDPDEAAIVDQIMADHGFGHLRLGVKIPGDAAMVTAPLTLEALIAKIFAAGNGFLLSGNADIGFEAKVGRAGPDGHSIDDDAAAALIAAAKKAGIL